MLLGEWSTEAVLKELKLFEMMEAFVPQDPHTLTEEAKMEAMEVLMFLEVKRMGWWEGIYADGTKQKFTMLEGDWTPKFEVD